MSDAGWKKIETNISNGTEITKYVMKKTNNENISAVYSQTSSFYVAILMRDSFKVDDREITNVFVADTVNELETRIDQERKTATGYRYKFYVHGTKNYPKVTSVPKYCIYFDERSSVMNYNPKGGFPVLSRTEQRVTTELLMSDDINDFFEFTNMTMRGYKTFDLPKARIQDISSIVEIVKSRTSVPASVPSSIAPSPVPQKEKKWYYMGDNKQWVEYPEPNQSAIQIAFSKPNVIITSIVIGIIPYYVDRQSMTQYREVSLKNKYYRRIAYM